MKRNTFLRILSLTSAVLASPVSGIVKGYVMLREKTGIKTDAGGKPEAEQDEFRKQHGFERVGSPIDIVKAF